jgi:F-type H+-transporting ATPase subunit b
MLNPAAGVLLASGGLTDVDTVLFFSTLVLFVVFAAVMSKLAWKPLLQMIEERERGVREGVEGAQKANTEAQALLEKHKEMLREAGREREDILKRALKEADTVKTEAVAKARTESEQIVARAREQMLREKDQAILELRKEVADIAMEAAGRIVTSSLTPAAQRKLVDEFISGLPKA